MIKKFQITDILKKILFGEHSYDHIVEGPMAHHYPETHQDKIRKEYLMRWAPKDQVKTPDTHPWLFDPCEPPNGWAYDPFYELWLKTDE
jgi:hypothetical protein